jgi:hypothetical protein
MNNSAIEVQGLFLSSLYPVKFGPVNYTVFYMYTSANARWVFIEKPHNFLYKLL